MAQTEGKPKREMEYRTAGAYALDMWQAGLGNRDAVERLDLYHRAAEHQLTTDSTGVLPEPVIGAGRQLRRRRPPARLSARAAGRCRRRPGRGRRSHSTRRSLEQTTEKTELESQKMIISEVTGTAQTFGGYVNVCRQIIDWISPQIMDIVIGDLAAQYALQTENDATDTFLAAATAASTNLATGANTAAQVTAAFWGAVGQVYAGTKGQGRVIAAMPPQMLGLLGPLFAPVNPENAQSTGFNAVNYGQGAAGSHQRRPDLRHRRTGRQQDPGHVHRSGGGLRNPCRPAPGRRAFRARRPGRLRRLLHAAGDRRDRDHRDHEDAMSENAGTTRTGRQSGSTRSGQAAGAPAHSAPAAPSLDDMTKDELLAYAKEREISPANAAMSKDEIRESIENA